MKNRDLVKYLESVAMDEGVRDLEVSLAEHKKHCVAQPGNCPKEKELKGEIEKIEAPKDRADEIGGESDYDREGRYGKLAATKKSDINEILSFNADFKKKVDSHKAEGVGYRDLLIRGFKNGGYSEKDSKEGAQEEIDKWENSERDRLDEYYGSLVQDAFKYSRGNKFNDEDYRQLALYIAAFELHEKDKGMN